MTKRRKRSASHDLEVVNEVCQKLIDEHGSAGIKMADWLRYRVYNLGFSQLELAKAYQKYIDGGLSQRKIAHRLGVSQAHVSQTLSIFELPAVVRCRLEKTNVPKALVSALLKIKSEDEQLELLQRYCNGELTAEQALQETQSKKRHAA